MNRQKITPQRISAGTFAAGILLIIIKAPHSFDVGIFFVIVAAGILGWDRRRWPGMIGGAMAAILGAMALMSLRTNYAAGPLPAWALFTLISALFAYASFRRIK